MKVFLYLLLIFSFPLGVLTRFSITPSVHIYLQDIFVALIILVYTKTIVSYLTNSKNIIKYACLVLFCISVLGILTHVHSILEFVIAILYMARLIAYILIFIPLTSMSYKNLQVIKHSMLISGFIFVVFGYLQYIFYPNLRNLYYLGWDEHLYRLFSTLLDPNFAGTYILLFLLFFLSYVFLNFKKSGLFTRIFYIAAGLLVSLSIFLTYSRSVYITSIISLMLYVYLLGFKKLTVAVVAIFMFGLFLLPQNFGGEGVNLLRTASIFSRLESNTQGLIIFINNPIVGVGYNSLRFVQVEYGFVNLKNALTSHAVSGFPNSYIVLLATTGLLGFGTAIFIFVKLLILLRAARKHNKYSLYATTVLVSFIAVLTNSLFENTLFYGPIIIWLVLLLGIQFGFGQKKKA